MAVIPESHVNLMRKRKEFQRLVNHCCWQDIPAMERQLFDYINNAVEAPSRSPRELLSELSTVISVYKELSILCRLYHKNLAP